MKSINTLSWVFLFLDFTFQQKMERYQSKKINVLLEFGIQNNVVAYKAGSLFWLTSYEQERKKWFKYRFEGNSKLYLLILVMVLNHINI